MTLAHSHDLGSLGDGKLVFQNAVENLNPCLFLLIQRYIPHRDDIFADQLAGDRIVEHQQSLFTNFDRVNREIFTVFDPLEAISATIAALQFRGAAWRTGRFPEWK